jgi:hypothetical protein
MALGPAGGYQFLADLFRKGNIDQGVAMDVADFSSP